VGLLFRSLSKNRRLVKDLLVRDLKGRYAGSVMGFFWSIVFPLVNLVVYMFVFRIVFGMRWGDQMSPVTVGLVLLVGIVVWQAFAEGVARMTNTLVENRNLIQKVVFPAEVLPIHLTLSSMTNMLIGILVGLLGLAAVIASGRIAAEAAASHTEYRHMGVGWSLVCLPLLMLIQATLMLGIGSFLAAFNLILRDTHHVIGVVLMVWMFMTPIVYPDFQVTKAGFGWVLYVNPIHWMVDSYREVLLFASWPKPEFLAGFAAVSFAVLFLGMKFFMAQKPRFPDLL
jgi:ABC-type polysaccharide/polyol phosphate export permease